MGTSWERLAQRSGSPQRLGAEACRSRGVGGTVLFNNCRYNIPVRNDNETHWLTKQDFGIMDFSLFWAPYLGCVVVPQEKVCQPNAKSLNNFYS